MAEHIGVYVDGIRNPSVAFSSSAKQHRTQGEHSMKTTTRTAVGVLLAGAVLAGTATTPALAEQREHPGVQTVLDRAVTDGGVPGAVAEVQDGHHRWFGSAGVADLATGRERHPQDRFRIG